MGKQEDRQGPKNPPDKDGPKGSNKRNPRQQDIGARAQRDVGLMTDPQFAALDKQAGVVKSAYGGYNDAIAPMAQNFTTLSQGIQDNYAQDVQGMNQVFGGQPDMMANEQDAGRQTLNGLANAGSYQLANQQMRGADFLGSAQREGALSQRYAMDNIAQQQQDLLTKTPDMVKQRIDELRDQRLQNAMAKSEMKSNAAFSQMLQDQLGEDTATNPGGHNGRDGRDGRDGQDGEDYTPATDPNRGVDTSTNGRQPRRYVTETDFGGNSFVPPKDWEKWYRQQMQEVPVQRREGYTRKNWDDLTTDSPDEFSDWWDANPGSGWRDVFGAFPGLFR